MKRTITRTYAVLALLLLLSASSASAKENWLKLKSKNFVVVSNAGESDTRKLAVKLEGFRHALSLLFPNSQIETPLTTTVLLFKSQSSFKPFKPQYKGKRQDTVAGYFLPGADGNYIVLTSELGGVDPDDVIFHEYEHFITRNNLPNAPPWLDEGLAEFFSTFKISDDEMKATLGGPIYRHVFTLREGKLLPLDTLLKVNRRSPHYNESGKAGTFYAESWALVHYLMLENNGKRHDQLTKFIRALGQGLPLEENFRQSFQTDYKTIENELRSYVRRNSFPILNINFHKQLDFAKDTRTEMMTHAEVQYYLGDLLLRLRRLDEAEPYLKKSLELDAAFTMSQISLGILRMRQERLPEARKLLESAIAGDSSNYLGHVHYGHLLRQEERYEEAIKSYQQAIQLKPDLAQLHSDVGHAYLNLGREEEAVEAFKRVTRLDPRNPYAYWTRSFVYLSLARGSLAATDARMFLRLQGWQDDRSSYMALALHFGLRQSKQMTPAAKSLEESLTKLDATEWAYPIIRYLQHQITAEDLLALATDNDKLTEAHAYIGLDLSLNGKSEEALPHLHWVREKGNKDFVEYPLALAEIERIGAAGKSKAP